MKPTKVLILPKLIYKFNKIVIEITIGFYNNWETGSKLTIEIFKETRIAMTFFKNKVGRLYLLKTKSYYKATVIKGTRTHKQINGLKLPQKQIIQKNVLFMTRMALQSSGEWIISSINHARPIWYCMEEKNETGPLLLIISKTEF